MNPKITTEEDARIGYEQWKTELYQSQEATRLQVNAMLMISMQPERVHHVIPAQQLHQAERQASKTEADALAQRIYDGTTPPDEPHNGGGTKYVDAPRLSYFETHEQYLICRHPMLWITGDFRVIHIKRMSNSHLGNILRAWPRDGSMVTPRKHNEAALIAEAQARGIDRRDDWFRPEQRSGSETPCELPPSHGWDRAKRLMSDLPGTYRLKILNNRLVRHKDVECLEYLLQNEDGQLRLWRARIDSIGLRRFQIAAGLQAGWAEGAAVVAHLRNISQAGSTLRFEKVPT